MWCQFLHILSQATICGGATICGATRVILTNSVSGVCSRDVVVYHPSLDPFAPILTLVMFWHSSVSTILGGKLQCSTLLNLKLQNPFQNVSSIVV